MKIALCSIGSRGDIQPFLILGEYLSSCGHEVIVSSAEMYKPLATKYNVNYKSFVGDYQSIVDDEAMKKEIGKNPFTIGKKLKEKVYPIIENSLDTFYELLQWCDVVIYHPKTLIDSIGFEMRDKLIKGYVVPAFTPTRDFSNPLFSFKLPQFMNRMSYKLINKMIGTVKTPVKNFKSRQDLKKSPAFIDTPIIYGVSPSVIKLPEDYPSNHYFTGLWTQKNTEGELSKEVTNFMSDDTEVLIITFGSMPYKSKIDINQFIEAILKDHNIKILIIKAWGLKEFVINESSSVKAIDSAPFERLFPMADYLIHHGGAGTTATALESGIPQMICPVLYPVGDQYFWGSHLNKIGVSPKPIPLKKLNPKELSAAISEMKTKKMKSAATELKSKLESENGLEIVQKIVEQIFKESNAKK